MEDATITDAFTRDSAPSDDGAADGDAAPHDADAGDRELLTNGGFETPGAGCGPDFRTVNATAERTGPARTGVHACRVCNSSGAAGRFGLRHAAETPGAYELQAHVRLAPDGGAPDLDSYIQLSDSDGAFIDAVVATGPLRRSGAHSSS